MSDDAMLNPSMVEAIRANSVSNVRRELSRVVFTSAVAQAILQVALVGIDTPSNDVARFILAMDPMAI